MVDCDKCQICYMDYDLENHIAVTLRQCGHNICKFCVDNILQSQNKTCPVCRKHFPFGLNNKYTIALSIQGKVEYESKFQKCSIHEGKVLDLYCRTDKRRICIECQYSSGSDGHKSHYIERIKDLEPEISAKLAIYLENQNKGQKAYEEARNLLVDSRLDEMNSFKELERVTKLVAFESFINAKAVVDEKEVQFNDKYSQDSENKGQQLADFCNDVKVARSHLNKPVVAQYGSKMRIEGPGNFVNAKISSNLSFQLADNELVINAGGVLNKGTVLDIEKWEKEVTKISILFNKFNYNEEDKLVLDYIYTRLQNKVTAISIEYQGTMSILTPKTRFEEHLVEFPKLVFSRPNNLKDITLRFVKSKGSDRYVRFLAERILPRTNGLTSLNMVCEHTDLEESSLLDFAKTAPLLEKLKSFGLTLKKISIQPRTLASLRSTLQNMDFVEADNGIEIKSKGLHAK